MEKLLKLLEEKPAIGLVGASDNTIKYGNIIFRNLVEKGFKVLPINPTTKTVEGHKAYKGLAEATGSEEIDMLVYVIPPKNTKESLEQAHALGLKRVWIQPGAGDENVRSYLEENGFEYIFDDCVMLKS